MLFQKAFNPVQESQENVPPIFQVEYLRTSTCEVLSQSKKCKNCHERELQKRKQEKITLEKAIEPLK